MAFRSVFLRVEWAKFDRLSRDCCSGASFLSERRSRSSYLAFNDWACDNSLTSALGRYDLSWSFSPAVESRAVLARVLCGIRAQGGPAREFLGWLVVSGMYPDRDGRAVSILSHWVDTFAAQLHDFGSRFGAPGRALLSSQLRKLRACGPSGRRFAVEYVRKLRDCGNYPDSVVR